MTSTKAPLLFIRADATTQIGTGHIMRCIALAQAWQNRDRTPPPTHLIRRLRNRPIAHLHPDPRDLKETLEAVKQFTPFSKPFAPCSRLFAPCAQRSVPTSDLGVWDYNTETQSLRIKFTKLPTSPITFWLFDAYKRLKRPFRGQNGASKVDFGAVLRFNDL